MSCKRIHDSDSDIETKKQKNESKITRLFVDYRDIAKLIANLLDYQSLVNFASLCKDSLVLMSKRHVISDIIKRKGKEKETITIHPNPNDLLETTLFELREITSLEEQFKLCSNIKNIRIYSKWIKYSETLCNCETCFQKAMENTAHLFKKVETIELVRFPRFISFTIDSTFPNLRNFRFYSIQDTSTQFGKCLHLNLHKDVDELGLYSQSNLEITLRTSPEHVPIKIKRIRGNCNLEIIDQVSKDKNPMMIRLIDKRRVQFY